MRDIKRIRPFLEKIEALWTEYPDLRFGQLIMAIAKTEEHNPTLFYMEEEEFLEKLEALENQIKNK